MTTIELARQIGGFIRARKRYVLVPLILALLLIGLLVVLAETSPLSPFIYPLF